MEYAISVRGLRKSFKLSAKQRKLERTDARVKTAVDGLSFDVAPGEIYGLLGPNGAGKTTTLRMLAALVKPDEGDALIEGVSVVDDPAGVRSLIGFLTSELKLEDVFSPDYLFDFFSELHHVDAPVRDERKRRGRTEDKQPDRRLLRPAITGMEHADEQVADRHRQPQHKEQPRRPCTVPDREAQRHQ